MGLDATHPGALLRVLDNGRERMLPLSDETFIGRSSQLTWTLDDPRAPSFWLELRYFGSRGWGWREGAGRETRAMGRRVVSTGGGLHRADFRALEVGEGAQLSRRTRVVLERGGPPAAFAVDLRSGEMLVGEAFDALVEVLGGRARAAAWERTPLALEQVDSHGVLLTAGRLLRVSVPVVSLETEQAEVLRVPADDLHLSLSCSSGIPACTLRWLDSGLTLDSLSAESARILIPYALWLLHSGPGVPMSATLAYQYWHAAGGRAAAGKDALHLKRRWLRTQLDRAGVIGADRLLVPVPGPQGGVYLNLRVDQVDASQELLVDDRAQQ